MQQLVSALVRRLPTSHLATSLLQSASHITFVSMLLDKGDGGCCVTGCFALLDVGTVLLSRRCCLSGRSSPLGESDVARFIFQILVSAKVENNPSSRTIESLHEIGKGIDV